MAWLYWRARVCERFPAYRLDELRSTPARELFQAMELLDIRDELRARAAGGMG